MDEVSIYNRALSAAEIQGIYAADSAGKCLAGTAPFISSQPTDQTLSVGGIANFTVTAGGTAPLAYQWYFNGANIAGATNPLLVLGNVQLTNTGTYYVVVTNLAGSVTSSNAHLAVVASLPCAPTPSNLVSWWRGEGSALDATGTNNGVLEGRVGFAPGEVNQAFTFNGTDADVRVPASASLNLGAADGITMETWINPAEVMQQHPLVEWNDGRFGVHLWIASTTGGGRGSLWVDIKDTSLGDHFSRTPTGLLVSNVWQHVAATYARSNGSTVLYINGVARAQATLGVFTPRTIGDLYLGLRPFDGGAGTRFVGLMDEVSLYSRALSAVEIQAIYNAGSGGKCPLPPPLLTPPTIIARAPSPVIKGLGFNVLTFRLSIPTEAGTAYVVEYKDRLADPSWQTLTTVDGTGLDIQITDNGLTNATRFYRVRAR